MTAIRRLMDAIEPAAARLGYRRRRNTFWRERDDVRVVASYETRRAASDTLFTTTLQAFILPIADKRGDAHWTGRIGELLPVGQDKWWPLQEDELQSVAHEHVGYFVDVIAPALDHYGRASFLVNEWREGRYTHISEPQRVRFLERATAAGY
jgi:hypothetical protein